MKSHRGTLLLAGLGVCLVHAQTSDRNRVWSLRATMCNVGWDDPSCKPR